jgi:uncharacterized protein YjeT (DUF2065 family)
MPLEILVERWFAIGSVVFGVSHILYPGKWAALSLPLRERESGALLVGTFYLPLGVAIVLAHNVWVWDLRVIVTFIGWLMVAKGVGYLLSPRALSLVMPPAERLERGFRIAGWVLMVLGALLTYDLFHRSQ